jgi:hypothetical protein
MVNVAGHDTPDENPNPDPPPDGLRPASPAPASGASWPVTPPPPPGQGGPPPFPAWGAPPLPPFGPSWPGTPDQAIGPGTDGTAADDEDGTVENGPADEYPPFGPPPADPLPGQATTGRAAGQAPVNRTRTDDPWRIPPQAPWDPSVEPLPGGGARPEPEPTGTRPPAYREPPGTALDLPPSATAPRSTPRPPVDPGVEGRHGPPRPVSPAVFDEPWRRETPGRSGPPTRAVLIGVAGVAVAGLIAGGVVLLSGGGHGGPKPDAAPAARPAADLFPAGGGTHTDGLDQELLNVTASGSTVVAIGGEFNTDYRAEFFVSTDGGRTFRLADVHTSDGQEPPYGDVPRRIAGTPGAWVALGSSPSGTTVWTSHDAVSWTRQPDDVGSAFNRPDRIGRIVRTRSGFVAVGDTSAKGDYSDASAVVWWSADGRHWDRHSADELGISAGGRPLSLIDAAAVGDVIVAHGWSVRGRSAPADLTWRSADGGRSWAPVSIPQPKGSTGLGVTATPSGFVAARNLAGTTGKGSKRKPVFSGVVFGSSDGARWSEIGAVRVPGYYGLRRISGSDRGLAALIDTGGELTVVRSADGRSWNVAGRLPMPKSRDVESVAVTAGATIIAGRDTTGDGNDALLEVRDTQGTRVPVNLFGVPGGEQPDRTIAGLVPGRGVTLALGSVGGDAAAWTSADGDRWIRADGLPGAFARPGRQRLLSAAQDGTGWLAVGYDGLTPKRPLVVTSTDGRTWQAADGTSAFKASDGAQLLTSATAAGPGGHVIVGADGSSAAAWYSADLRSWHRGTGSGHGDLDGKPGAERWTADVAAGSFGYVAVGGLNDPTAGNAPRGRPAVWNSADGKEWHIQQLPLPAGTTEATFAHVATVNGRLMAAGTARTSGGSTVFAFVSPDGGRSWAQADLPGTEGATALALTALAATPHGFVAAAGSGRGGRSDVALWTSADGRAFAVEHPRGFGLSGRGDQWLTGLAAAPGGLVAVGVTADHRGEQLTLWRRPLP